MTATLMDDGEGGDGSVSSTQQRQRRIRIDPHTGGEGGDGSRALAEERRRRISDIIEAQRAGRLDALSLALGVSQATIRRDLQVLESEGALRRVHGGAVAVNQNSREPVFDAKAAKDAEEKERIAARALELISPTDILYLDSGSTVLALARLLVGWDQLTVVTNSLPVVLELLGRGPRLIMIGGEVRERSRALVGPLASFTLEHLHFDRAFMGAYAVSPEDGIMTTDPAEAFTYESVMVRAAMVVVLAASGKLGRTSFVRAGQLGNVDFIVTDSGVVDGVRSNLEQRGISVIVA